MRISLDVEDTITIMQENSMYMMRSGFRARKALRMTVEAMQSRNVRFSPDQLAQAVRAARQELKCKSKTK